MSTYTGTISSNDFMLTSQRVKQKAENKKIEVANTKAQIQLDCATTIEEAENKIKDAYWCEKIGNVLVKYYPGHGWEVHVDLQNGIANIFNRHMSGLHGYRLKTEAICLISLDQDIMRIGGEILERFGLNREKFDADHVLEIQRLTQGRAKADLS